MLAALVVCSAASTAHAEAVHLQSRATQLQVSVRVETACTASFSANLVDVGDAPLLDVTCSKSTTTQLETAPAEFVTESGEIISALVTTVFL